MRVNGWRSQLSTQLEHHPALLRTAFLLHGDALWPGEREITSGMLRLAVLI